MDPRLTRAQEDYRRALPYADPFTYDALQHIPRLIQMLVAAEKTIRVLTEQVNLETLDPFDGKEEG